MSEDQRLVIQGIIGMTTAFVAAYFSARWAVKKAFAEKWWDRKEKVYTEIIEALYDLVRYSSLSSEEALTGMSDHPVRKKFEQQYSEAYWKIQKMTDIGPFVISNEASLVLQNLRDRPELKWHENPPWEIFEADCAHYRKALQQIRECAKRDLKG